MSQYPVNHLVNELMKLQLNTFYIFYKKENSIKKYILFTYFMMV